MKKRLICFVFAFLLIFPVFLFAMSEDEYAQMAAENYRILYDAKGDGAAVSKKSQEFLERFSEQQKQEYVEKARRVLQDKELASRISKKIVELLTKMGYKVNIGQEGNMDSIAIIGGQN